MLWNHMDPAPKTSTFYDGSKGEESLGRKLSTAVGGMIASGSDAVHAKAGPIQVSDGSFLNDTLTDGFIKAAGAYGYPEIKDARDTSSVNGAALAPRCTSQDVGVQKGPRDYAALAQLAALHLAFSAGSAASLVTLATTEPIRATVGPMWHCPGTAGMPGSIGEGAVDAELNVFGVRRLMVVDLSLVAGNATSMALAVGEKAAGLVVRELGCTNPYLPSRGIAARALGAMEPRLVTLWPWKVTVGSLNWRHIETAPRRRDAPPAKHERHQPSQTPRFREYEVRVSETQLTSTTIVDHTWVPSLSFCEACWPSHACFEPKAVTALDRSIPSTLVSELQNPTTRTQRLRQAEDESRDSHINPRKPDEVPLD
ncbi:hypothetical protein MAPG_00175 [Magnaporthiopsis poae ATCC 64411]|uniref:Glucose-methanol-choline oxidoreductase C-terminal domain-containing protein n=1 Tax=Magnaporthiopsis poae (strain ATCC 64411 / 73-15) TaxID=644358 RepID=A0A0C4DKA9_MAGP6|nr:hypothetical protein MAPG_00175 [Magnaporthiopsis poae ATCC 64411]